MTDITRRSWLTQSALLSAGVTGFTASEQSGKEMIARDKRLRVVVVGAHPDDPESSCGGTMCRYADHGHEVTAVYLTRGEAGIKGKTAEEAAAIRTAEGEQTGDFHPTHYVDITPVLDRKRKACLAHISQDPLSFYGQYHEPMQRFRGMEYRCQAAEAFVSAPRNPDIGKQFLRVEYSNASWLFELQFLAVA
jgi:LmbE family N-acetylglucosaminyl deacetylase